MPGWPIKSELMFYLKMDDDTNYVWVCLMYVCVCQYCDVCNMRL